MHAAVIARVCELLKLSSMQAGESGAAGAMRCFVVCSSSALLQGAVAPRMLMLDGLTGRLRDRALLEESHIPYTRLCSAYRQAVTA